MTQAIAISYPILEELGIGTAVGRFISGILLVIIDGQGLYLTVGLAVLIFLASALLLRRNFPL